MPGKRIPYIYTVEQQQLLRQEFEALKRGDIPEANRCRQKSWDLDAVWSNRLRALDGDYDHDANRAALQ